MYVDWHCMYFVLQFDKASALARQSLYVKFDPLVKAPHSSRKFLLHIANRSSVIHSSLQLLVSASFYFGF